MHRLNNPSAGLIGRVSFLFRPFLPSAPDARNKAPQHRNFLHFFPAVPRVKTEVLRMPAYIRLPDNNSIKQVFKRGRIIPVGSGRRQRQGYSFPVNQEVPFASVFFPAVGFFPTVSTAKGALAMHPSPLT
jgi:hypothetical protein